MNCVALCFNEATAYLKQMLAEEEFTPKKQLRKYFDARTAFFVKNPLMLGIFANAAFHPPIALSAQIKACRQEFDALNKAVLTAFLNSQQLRKGFSAEMIIDEFSIYMDFFNTRFKTDFSSHDFSEKLIYEHEERSHRQLDILLNGVLGKENE